MKGIWVFDTAEPLDQPNQGPSIWILFFYVNFFLIA